MFNKMKRFMAILLSLTMLLSAMPNDALAETFSVGGLAPLTTASRCLRMMRIIR